MCEIQLICSIKMAMINELLEHLKYIILSISHDTLKVRKDSLTDIQICLQNAHEKIEFLELESSHEQVELQ